MFENFICRATNLRETCLSGAEGERTPKFLPKLSGKKIKFRRPSGERFRTEEVMLSG